MNLITAFIVILIAALLGISFLNKKWKGILVFSTILINAIISSSFAISTLIGNSYEFVFTGSLVTGPIHLQIDALTGWFVLIINIAFITGGFYGLFYLKNYTIHKNNFTLHGIAFLLLHASLISICAIQNSIIFLIAWEIMALTSVIVIIFDHEKITTIQAGINYLIQSHISIVFLMLGFMWVAYQTGSYDFSAIAAFAASHQGNTATALFICFFIAFAIKTGFVPFHTWLPYAHPVAPSHISGIMSGVIIKIGIFGMLRMLLIIKPDFTIVGFIILILSVISGLYGVMLAIIQHNLKKLLAYHSIENIGIIGMGIGIGCIGLGSQNLILASLGFGGALLHIWNHALFKSLLFYAAGNIYQATHSLNIEQFGGLIKKMPQTAFLFLIASIAICGIPPFNGFISEFLIYNGLFQWLQNTTLVSMLFIVFSILGLVLIGGLAILCFTKVFGIVFQGSTRHNFEHEIKEVPFIQLIPMYILALLICCIGMFPTFFLSILLKPVSLFTKLQQEMFIPFQGKSTETLQSVSYAVWGFVAIIIIVFLFRKWVINRRISTTQSTWGCAYIAPTSKLQYSASSYIRSYSKLFGIFLLSYKKEKEIQGVFPTEGHLETHPYDRVEHILIDIPLKAYKSFMNRFLFLHNGNLQFYILYGIIFIALVICIPLFYDKIIQFIDFLNRL